MRSNRRKIRKDILATKIDLAHMTAEDEELLALFLKKQGQNFAELANAGGGNILAFPHRTKFFPITYFVDQLDPQNDNLTHRRKIHFSSQVNVYPPVHFDLKLGEANEAHDDKLLHDLFEQELAHNEHELRVLKDKPYYITGKGDTDTGLVLTTRRLITFSDDMVIRKPIMIDPAEMDEQQEQLLNVLIHNHHHKGTIEAFDHENNKPKKYMVIVPNPDGELEPICQLVILAKGLELIERKNKNNRDIEKYSYVVCGAKPFSHGGEGLIYLSEGKIRLPENQNDFDTVYKPRPNEKTCVAKVYLTRKKIFDITGEEDSLSYSVEGRSQIEKAKREYAFLRMNSIFHVSKPRGDDERAVLVMRKIYDKDLLDVINDDIGDFDEEGYHIDSMGIFTNDQRIALCIMLLEELRDNVHGKGMIHRDIQPCNIRVKLDKESNVIAVAFIDFGLAEWVKRVQEQAMRLAEHQEAKVRVKKISTDCVGTLGYAPPEAFSSSRLMDEKSDVYSLCMVLKDIWQALGEPEMRYKDLSNNAKQAMQEIMAHGTKSFSLDRASLDDVLEAFYAIRRARELGLEDVAMQPVIGNSSEREGESASTEDHFVFKLESGGNGMRF